jgi:hypothetical protein
MRLRTILGSLATAGSLTAALLLPLALAGDPPPYAPAVPGCGDGEIPNTTVNCPSQRAWEVLVAISKPSEAVPRKAEWQTWPLDQDVFPPCPDPAKCTGNLETDDPQLCPTYPKPDRIPPAQPPSKVSAHFRTVLRDSGILPGDPAEIAQDTLLAETELVYRNPPSVRYIVENRLWFQEGQVEAFARAEPPRFPLDSVVTKVHWLPIEERAKSRYHWSYLLVKDSKTGKESQQLVGMVGLVFMAKELPTWFWAAFEHVDNLGACDFIGCYDDFGAEPAYTPSKTPFFERYPAPTPTERLKRLVREGGLDPVWLNYRLKGVQLDFTDGAGRPTLLGDSQIEAGFLATSSCMTCHSRATIAPTAPVSGPGTQVPHNVGIFSPTINGQSLYGAPNPAWFRGPSGALGFLQLDFTWGLTGAQAADPAIRALNPQGYQGCPPAGGS